ncbi:MAG: S8 family serine peptidase, partial [Candidatus Nanohaloarchaea archaeon]
GILDREDIAIIIIIVAFGVGFLAFKGVPILEKPGATTLAQQGAEQKLTNDVIVVFKGRGMAQSREAYVQSRVRALKNYGFTTRWSIPRFSMASGEIPSDRMDDILQINGVWGIARDWITKVGGPVQGSAGAEALTLDQVKKRLNIEKLWRKESKGENITVGIIDSGVDKIPTINLTARYTVRGGVKDQFGHGTAIAYIYSRLAPKADIVSIKALGSMGTGRSSDVIKAMSLVADLPPKKRPDVLNLSLGVPPATFSPMAMAADMLDTRYGITVVTAAGNLGPAQNTVMAPATGDETIAVSAITSENEIATYSSRGPQVDVCSYGNVYTLWQGRIQAIQGTSVAAPIVGAQIADYLGAVGAPQTGGGGVLPTSFITDGAKNYNDRRIVALSAEDLG